MKLPTWEEIGIATALALMGLCMILALAVTPTHAQVYGGTVWTPPRVLSGPCGVPSFFASPTYIVNELAADIGTITLEETNNESSSAGCTPCIFDRSFHIRAGIICSSN
jgi:hypothetical protein